MGVGASRVCNPPSQPAPLWSHVSHLPCALLPCRATGLPEKYCIEAERKANILPAASVN